MKNNHKINKKENQMNNLENLISCTYEELAHALYIKGERDGVQKITDKTQWREFVIAEKLGHKAFDKISAGAGSEKYGADAYEANGKTAEYKSKAVNDDEVRNLTEKIKYQRTGETYVPLKVPGIYNGANHSEGAIPAYSKHNHYFGVFWKEKCVMVIKPHTEYVIETLTENKKKWKPGKTTNLNTVTVDLRDTSTYEVAFKDEEWFEENK